MFTNKGSRIVAPAAAALLLGAMLAGCAVYPHRTYYSGAVIVGSTPPPARVEVIGVAPWPGAVWITGRWVWLDHWVWQDGYWAKPPRPATKWVPGRWTPHGPDRYQWVPGRWR